MIHSATIKSRDPIAEIYCSCGRTFEGDWDDVVQEWHGHFADYDELVTSEPILLTRAGGKRFLEIMEEPRKPLPEPPARRIDLQDPGRTKGEER